MLGTNFIKDADRNPFRKIYDSSMFKDAKGKPTDMPLIIDIEPTNSCNLNCDFCARQVMKRPIGFMDYKLYTQIIDECTKHNIAIKFSRWGEPFLHPKIYAMLKYAYMRCLITHVTTNGILIDTKKLQHIYSLNFSFQGTSAKEYQNIRNNEMYDSIVEKINIISKKKIRPALGITTTVQPGTPEYDIAKFVDYWKKRVEQVSWGYTYYGHLDNKKDKQLWKGRNKPCNDVFTRMAIDWDGTISACCADYDRKMVIGRFPKDSLRDAWNSKKMNQYRKLMVEGKINDIGLCRQCANRW